MAAEVASALELLQAPVLNPLKLEVVMAKADHLTKSLSLHWKAGRVVENPSGCLVVYPPTLHLRKHEEEEVIVEEVIEEQNGVMAQDESSPLVRRTQNIDVENQNMTKKMRCSIVLPGCRCVEEAMVRKCGASWSRPVPSFFFQ